MSVYVLYKTRLHFFLSPDLLILYSDSLTYVSAKVNKLYFTNADVTFFNLTSFCIQQI